MSALGESLLSLKSWLQRSLFPDVESEVGEITEDHKRLLAVLTMLDLGRFVKTWHGVPGRPKRSRIAIARCFVAKMIFKMPETKHLRKRLQSDPKLRHICGWTSLAEVPSESTFSRAFGEFAQTALPAKVHEALIKATHADRLVGHVLRDATAIEAREKPAKKAKKAVPSGTKKRGRPKKGEERPPEPTRVDRQAKLSLQECLDDLPTQCDVGTKKNSKGYKETWIGYKLHIDVGDGEIPLSAVLTSASLHDSQVAIPLAKMTSERVTSLYDLMDSGYDCQGIRDFSCSLGHVPLIDVNPRGDKKLKANLEAEAKGRRRLNFKFPEEVRYNERSGIERVNGRAKDDYGATTIRVRGHAKVYCHLMFGLVAMAAERILRLIT